MLGQHVLGQSGLVAPVLWELDLPREFAGRLYETAIVPGEPRVLATSLSAILSLDESGEIQPLVELEPVGERAESATLAADASRAGILTYQNHAASGFRVVDLRGETIGSVESPLHFHYRLAPDGDTFVGIDAGGEHVPSKADRFIYRFYDESGNAVAEVISEDPQALDSAYTPDGAAFILNSAKGLAAYDVTHGDLLWQLATPAFFFAPASAESELVALSSTEEPNVVRLFRSGNLLWRFTLEGNVRNLAVSPSGTFVLATNRTTAHLLSAPTGKPLWAMAMPDQALAINSAAVTDRGVVALGAQHNDLTRGLALVLDREGGILFQREFSHSLSNAWIPRVQFDRTGTAVLLRTREELLLMEVR